jgi:hypothetical protein
LDGIIPSKHQPYKKIGVKTNDKTWATVDVVVLAAGEPRFDSNVFAELERQAESGTIRVLDAMVLLKDQAGQGWRVDLEDLPEEEAAKMGFIETGIRGLFRQLRK